MELGGYIGTLSWDGFLYVLLQFCTLSKIELAQTLFFIIMRQMKCWTVRFLTSSQLEEFYGQYDRCPVGSFNTAAVEFTQLPLAKFQMIDFVELVHDFGQ